MDAATTQRSAKRAARIAVDEGNEFPQTAAEVASPADLRRRFGRWGGPALVALAAGVLDLAKDKVN